MRFHCLGVAAVLSAAQQLAPVPAPQADAVASCSTEVSACVTRYEAEMKASNERVLAGCKEEVSAMERKKDSVVRTLEADLTATKQKHSQAEARIQNLEKSGDGAVVELRRTIANLEKEKADRLKEVEVARENERVSHKAVVENLQKEATSLQATLAGKDAEISKYTTALQKSEEEAQRRLNAREAEMQATLATREQALKAELTAAVKKQVEASYLDEKKQTEAWKQSMLQSSEQREAEMKKLTSELASTRNAKSDIEERLNIFENQLFSMAQYDAMTKNLKVLAGAMIQNAKGKINRIFKADVFELAHLQSLMIYHKVRPYAQPKIEMLQEHANEFMNKHQIQYKVLQGIERTTEAIKPYHHRVNRALDERMDRFIDNLNKSDSNIRTLFPTSYQDRIVTFLYLFTVAFVINALLTYILSAVYKQVAFGFGGFAYIFRTFMVNTPVYLYRKIRGVKAPSCEPGKGAGKGKAGKGTEDLKKSGDAISTDNDENAGESKSSFKSGSDATRTSVPLASINKRKR